MDRRGFVKTLPLLGAASGLGFARTASAQTTNNYGYVSVETFGAKGDGVTDDTAAINAAFAQVGSSGGTVFSLPERTSSIRTA
jgi:polygalacturonase